MILCLLLALVLALSVPAQVEAMPLSDCFALADNNRGTFIRGYYVPGGMKARQAVAYRLYFSSADYDQLVLGARCHAVSSYEVECRNPCGRRSGWRTGVPDGSPISGWLEELKDALP